MAYTYGVDYSWARPAATCLRDAGMRFVCRYLGDDNTGENLSLTEAKSIIAAGMDIVLVWQTGSSFMISNRAAGVEDAKIAKAQAAALGQPADRPIYFSLDVDPATLTSAQWTQVKEYLRGCADVLGLARVGVYGAFSAIEQLVPSYARWGWQTYAWSGGGWSSKAHLHQYSNNVTRCGAQVDLDRAPVADFGQWPREEDNMPTAAEVAEAVWAKSMGIPDSDQARPAYMHLQYSHKNTVEQAALLADLKAKLDAFAASGVVVDYAQIEAAVEAAVKSVLGALA